MDFSAEFSFAVGELGLLPDQFWELTYAEFYEMALGYKRKRKRRINELIYAAWHTAALSRQKEMPSLQNLLQDEDGPRREQTEDEMMTICKMLNAAFGGTVVEK